MYPDHTAGDASRIHTPCACVVLPSLRWPCPKTFHKAISFSLTLSLCAATCRRHQGRDRCGDVVPSGSHAAAAAHTSPHGSQRWVTNSRGHMWPPSVPKLDCLQGECFFVMSVLTITHFVNLNMPALASICTATRCCGPCCKRCGCIRQWASALLGLIKGAWAQCRSAT